MRTPRRSLEESGEVIVETVISLGLMAIVILGFAQQYLVTLDRMYHERAIAQLSLGPQISSIAYLNGDQNATPPIAPGFAALSSITSPTLAQFLDQFGSFFAHIDNGQSALFVALGYLTVDADTGVVTGKVVPSRAARYRGVPGGHCETNETSYLNQLMQYADNALETMRTTVLPPAVTPGPTPVTVPAAAGIKIYDVRIGNTVLKSYVTLLPYVFVLLCSEPRTYLFPQTPITTSIISPRGHAN